MFETRIYIASTKSLFNPELFEKLYKTVPQYRQSKIDGFSAQKEKCLSLGAGLLLSKALAEAGFDEQELIYSFKESGMPYFKNHPEISFSLSHSEERVMCGISLDPIGVDTEMITDRKEEGLDEWCKIESYAKATDTPMTSLIGGRTKINTEFHFKEVCLDDGYKYYICSDEFIKDSQVKVINFD